MYRVFVVRTGVLCILVKMTKSKMQKKRIKSANSLKHFSGRIEIVV